MKKTAVTISDDDGMNCNIIIIAHLILNIYLFMPFVNRVQFRPAEATRYDNPKSEIYGSPQRNLGRAVSTSFNRQWRRCGECYRIRLCYAFLDLWMEGFIRLDSASRDYGYEIVDFWGPILMAIDNYPCLLFRWLVVLL